ncbi:hypothetical protein [Streptomyces sp. 147326]|uniref:hypothetical protein n=1 Tax=Streptomyces sp. 147326 TaxID=3074379 RepID=UPI0038572A44
MTQVYAVPSGLTQSRPRQQRPHNPESCAFCAMASCARPNSRMSPTRTESTPTPCGKSFVRPMSSWPWSMAITAARTVTPRSTSLRRFRTVRS